MALVPVNLHHDHEFEGNHKVACCTGIPFFPSAKHANHGIAGSTYTSVYKVMWMMNQNVVIKEIRQASACQKALMLYELELFEKFPTIMPRIHSIIPVIFEPRFSFNRLAITRPASHYSARVTPGSPMNMKMAVDFVHLSLAKVINYHDLTLTWTIPGAISEVMEELESQKFVLRDMRLKSFRVIKCK